MEKPRFLKYGGKFLKVSDLPSLERIQPRAYTSPSTSNVRTKDILFVVLIGMDFRAENSF